MLWLIGGRFLRLEAPQNFLNFLLSLRLDFVFDFHYKSRLAELEPPDLSNRSKVESVPLPNLLLTGTSLFAEVVGGF